MKKTLFVLLFALLAFLAAFPQTGIYNTQDFQVKGFHLDLRIQVMTMDALKRFASQLHEKGMNTLIMEWEGSYPFESHPLIQNRYAYTKQEILSFVDYCHGLGIDVIPLQQSFGHVEYILRNYKYKELREDQENYSQVCPMKPAADSILFTDLFKELASTHGSPYIHIGGDETYLLGHCPLCRKQAEKVGKSRLYIDYIKMLCEIVIKMGKRPLVWADIALKYPEAIHMLPKGTIFIDWNYGWDMSRFGDHRKLLESGYEIWGAASLRSHPDNYFLTDWKKHFENIRTFLPAARASGYTGMIMTSWSTSGQYSTVKESETDIVDLYAIRHVYPVSAFNILLSAYADALKSTRPLDIEGYVNHYAVEQYGLTPEQSIRFWRALTAVPYEIKQGSVLSPHAMSVDALLDSAGTASKVLSDLQPSKNKDEFEQYRLMAAIRVQYIAYEAIEAFANSGQFDKNKIPEMLAKLNSLLDQSIVLDKRFSDLNKPYFYPAVLQEENELRNVKIRMLYAKLGGKKE